MAIDVNRKIGGIKLKWWALMLGVAVIVGLWWRSHNANQVPADETKVASRPGKRGARGPRGRPGRNRKGKNRSKGRYLVG